MEEAGFTNARLKQRGPSEFLEEYRLLEATLWLLHESQWILQCLDYLLSFELKHDIKVKGHGAGVIEEVKRNLVLHRRLQLVFCVIIDLPNSICT